MSLINVKNLKFGYERNLILNNISFSVQSGDYLCIVGENGTGKTTLIKLLLGLLPKYEGSVEYSEGLCKNTIGYLSQQSKHIGNFPASVREVIMSGFLSKKKSGFLYSKEQKAYAFEIAEQVGVKSILRRSFSELSGGQQQRVLLARSLCATKKLLLLDEPTSALDPLATAEFYSLVKSLNNSGVTVIMVSHDVTAAVRNASHILCLSQDSCFFGTTHEYIHSEMGKKMLLSDCPCEDCRHFANKGGNK